MSDLINNDYCRLCAKLQNKSKMISLQMNEEIKVCFQIEITSNDSLPKTICDNCCYQVTAIFQYYQQVQQAQELLNKIFFKSTFNIKLEEECSVKVENLLLENDSQVCTDDFDRNEDGRILHEVLVDKQSGTVKNESKRTAHQYHSNVWKDFKWLCAECGTTLESKPLLCEHYKQIHNKSPSYKCTEEDCCKIMRDFNSFRAHMKKHQNQFTFRCEQCGRFFNRNCRLREHINNVHENKSTSDFICSFCGKCYKYKHSLSMHKRIVHDLFRLECDICNKQFTTANNLANHKLIHFGEKPHICEICGHSFIHQQALQSHIVSRHSTLEKTIQCSLCSKMFKTNKQMFRHRDRVHLKIKKHECDICGKKYHLSTSLRVHKRLHTGELPFKCEFCKKRFRLKANLLVHNRQHTGERPYSCEECQHDFSNFANYNKHMKKKHGKKPRCATAVE